jgi:hypothetical protein
MHTSSAKWPFAILGILVGGLGCLLATRVVAAVSVKSRSVPVASQAFEEPTTTTKKAARTPPRLVVAPAPAPTSSVPAADPERRQAEFALKLENHAREAADPAWAATLVPDLERGLGAGGSDGGYSLHGIDCRARTCLAELEWSDYDAAVEGYRAALTADLGRSCATEIVLPRAAGSGPYRATLHLTCRR